MKGDSAKVKRIVSTENYIGALRVCLEARDDFKDLKYYRSAKGEEYAVMSDIIGQVLILDITGLSEDKILYCIAQVVCGKVPSNAVTDREDRLRIARLFK